MLVMLVMVLLFCIGGVRMMVVMVMMVIVVMVMVMMVMVAVMIVMVSPGGGSPLHLDLTPNHSGHHWSIILSIHHLIYISSYISS